METHMQRVIVRYNTQLKQLWLHVFRRMKKKEEEEEKKEEEES